MTSISIVNYFTTNGDVSDEALNVYIKKLLLTNCCTLEIIQKYLQCHNCTMWHKVEIFDGIARKYISTQSRFINTIDDFWQTVWQKLNVEKGEVVEH
ncbi:Receptor-type tyrosine-protein phosphatase [Trichinella spiralis]|uniref:Receptor-type tyrosine-protein phosphatase n=1 Tax=Trichinella spiralis TaxID=6334 RepID=A0ABR3KQT5_TRISP